MRRVLVVSVTLFSDLHDFLLRISAQDIPENYLCIDGDYLNAMNSGNFFYRLSLPHTFVVVMYFWKIFDTNFISSKPS